jgi:hypothetical protein
MIMIGRFASDEQRRILSLVHAGCCAYCNARQELRPNPLQAFHHICPYEMLGPTELWNLLPLCETCHSNIGRYIEENRCQYIGHRPNSCQHLLPPLLIFHLTAIPLYGRFFSVFPTLHTQKADGWEVEALRTDSMSQCATTELVDRLYAIAETRRQQGDYVSAIRLLSPNWLLKGRIISKIDKSRLYALLGRAQTTAGNRSIALTAFGSALKVIAKDSSKLAAKHRLYCYCGKWNLEVQPRSIYRHRSFWISLGKEIDEITRSLSGPTIEAVKQEYWSILQYKATALLASLTNLSEAVPLSRETCEAMKDLDPERGYAIRLEVHGSIERELGHWHEAKEAIWGALSYGKGLLDQTLNKGMAIGVELRRCVVERDMASIPECTFDLYKLFFGTDHVFAELRRREQVNFQVMTHLEVLLFLLCKYLPEYEEYVKHEISLELSNTRQNVRDLYQISDPERLWPDEYAVWRRNLNLQ